MKPTAFHPAISLRIICGILLVLAPALALPPTFAQHGAPGGHIGVAPPVTARPGMSRPGVPRPGVFGPGAVGIPRVPVAPFRNPVMPFHSPVMPFRNSVAPLRVFPPRRRRYFPIFPIVGFPVGFPGFYGLGYSAFWISDCDGFYGWGYACGTVSPFLSEVPESDYVPNGSQPVETPPAETFAVDGGGVGEQLPQSILLYLKDGSVFAVTRYTVSDGKLYYATAYGTHGEIDLDLLDLQKTVDENAARGVTFTLTPSSPASTNPASTNPASTHPGAKNPAPANPNPTNRPAAPGTNAPPGQSL